MTDVYLSDVLKALPSVFLMELDAIAGLNSFLDLCVTTQSEKLFIRRVIVTFDFGDYIPKTTSLGRFSISEFLDKVTLIYEENSNSFSRMAAIESPSDLLEQRDAEIEQMSGTETVEFVLIDGKWLRLEPLRQENINIRPEVPFIQSDRLTISSEPSVWNHFKMCAAIASSNDNPVVSLLTTEYGTIQIHASNDHQEYRAEITLIGGEPSSRQAIGIPVALIDEVSYWIETGLHTESYLDIWFDENQVKFGTKTNQVLAKIEEYQPPKFDWQSETPTLIKEMSEWDRQLLKSLLYQSSNEQLEWDTPRYYAPLIEFYQTVEHLFMRMSSYQQSVQTVSVGITELRDFVEYLDITQEALNLKVEVNARENYVIFFGDSPCQESEALVHFGYFILGVLADTQKGKG